MYIRFQNALKHFMMNIMFIEKILKDSIMNIMFIEKILRKFQI